MSVAPFLAVLVAGLLAVSWIPGGLAQEKECTTPSRTPGKCVAIQRCKNIWNIVNSPTPDSRYTPYINAAACSLPGVDRSICCQPTEVGPELVTPMAVTPPPVDSLKAKKLPTDCGQSVSDRIANGNVTKVFDYPWMAMLRYKQYSGGYIEGCGGSLIHKRYILTAAHCIKTRSTLTLEIVRLGEHDKRTDIDCNIYRDQHGVEIERDCAEPAEEYKVESFVVHPDYNRPKYSNDIGLVRLDRDVSFKYHIRPICLPVTPALQTKLYERYVVTGWGTTENQTGSDVLLEAVLPRVSNEFCQQKMAENRLNIQLSEKQMCAGGENNVDTCRGDSGGPLGFSSNFNGARFVQYGVVSAGVDTCGLKSIPGIYARVASYMDWILDNMTD